MTSNNNSLNQARKSRRDEFYTQLCDIEKEISQYKHHFENKTIYCNCDNPYTSNFVRYFIQNFNNFKLKRLLVTHYIDIPSYGDQLTIDHIEGLSPTGEYPHKISVTEVDNLCNETEMDITKIVGQGTNQSVTLTWNGDFRSDECITLLKESDIVVTNPPFSLFREHVLQLIEYGKQFIILGNLNAVTYKKVFPLIQNNQMWLGYDDGYKKWFQVPMGYTTNVEQCEKIENGNKYISLGNAVWFTNIDINKRHKKLRLYKQYSEKDYRKYDNYNAIEVTRTNDIPIDYDGEMGVPISFLLRYNPEQFEIVGLDKEIIHGLGGQSGMSLQIEGNNTYRRIIIQHRK